MKKTIVPLLLLTGIIACHKKTLPVITERKYEPSKTIVTSYPPPVTIVPGTITGKLFLLTIVENVMNYPTLYNTQLNDGMEYCLI